ncbi:hypothetical protein BVI434_1120045 [Burkholderia vietnamiensis]|nr:hypothetical protein BVI434_1120045 [Burkholderia vietnamiensis]
MLAALRSGMPVGAHAGIEGIDTASVRDRTDKTKNPVILSNHGASYFGGEGGIRTHGTGKPYA